MTETCDKDINALPLSLSNAGNRVWIGLGGNIGDVVAAMAQALLLLDAKVDICVNVVSSVYKTPPWGKLDQPWFYNACAELQTRLDPEALLIACQEVELAMKRQRLEHWGPRTLDIDLLIYDGLSAYNSKSLILPHPRMKERAFVMEPLAEIAPDLRLDSNTIVSWAKKLADLRIEKLAISSQWWKIPQ